MKKIRNSTIAYIFYLLSTIDYVSASYFNKDFTGLPFSPLIFGGIGSIFLFIHNSKIKESNNKVYELFKFCLFAVLISDDIIDESELEYSTSILNTLENELLLPTNPSRLEQEILNYDLNSIYEKIKIFQSTVDYQTKLNILSSCAILCVMDGQIDEVEQESIYKISNILNITEIDMKNIFNASIASYIDFKNSDRENLQINDSEVKNVVENKKAENKSNKNQIYMGIGVFTVLVIFGIYTSFQITTEESCDNINIYYDKLVVFEKDYLVHSEEAREIWNDYVQFDNDEYNKLTSEQQIILHSELNLYKISELIDKQKESLNSFKSLDADLIEIHDDHQLMITLLNELNNLSQKRIEISIFKYNLHLEYIEEIEKYYKDWDNAAEQNDNNLIDSLDRNFANYLNQIELDYEENDKIESLRKSNFDEIYLNFQAEAAFECDTVFED